MLWCLGVRTERLQWRDNSKCQLEKRKPKVSGYYRRALFGVCCGASTRNVRIHNRLEVRTRKIQLVSAGYSSDLDNKLATFRNNY